MGVELLAEKGALVPREETELLGNTAVRVMQAMAPHGEPITAIDMCCGAGNLACGIAHAVPNARFYASDLTDGCVSVARKNVVHTGLQSRVEIVQGDLFAPLQDKGLEGKVDVIICNPPYISSARLGKDRAQLLEHEPREAFDAGPYGLAIHMRVVKAPPYLRPEGASV
jgi:release factor glutamine methyltransferase